MLTMRIHGGMANQMFEFATGYSLSKQNDVPLQLDVTSFLSDPMREYSLGLWKDFNYTTTQDFGQHKWINETGLEYSKKYAAAVERRIMKEGFAALNGYFQCEDYFLNYREDLDKIFTPKIIPGYNPLLDKLIEQETQILKEAHPVFVTVRRTDYVGSDYHNVLPQEYYVESAHLINQLVKDPVFFIFTDDPEWVRDNFQFFPYKWVLASGNWDRTIKGKMGREDIELSLMRLCRHAIMANSSYSWWGAWLGRADREGIVIRPKQWFGPACEESSEDICPVRWLPM